MELKQPAGSLVWDDVIYELQEALTDKSGIYLVGGAVRDAFRRHPIKDVDVVCTAKAQSVARRIANIFRGDYYALDKTRDVGRAIITYNGKQWIVDVASLRGRTLEEDLQDRDFTINAMCVSFDGDMQGIYDPMGGMEDWQHRVLRRCSPESIANDPIRALRAIRQSLQFGLRIEPETRENVRQHGTRILETSMERVRDEFFAMVGGSKPGTGIAALRMLGFLHCIVPEIEDMPEDIWRYALNVIDKLHILLTVITPKRDDNIAANAEFGIFVYLLDRYRGWLKQHLAQEFSNDRTYPALLLLTALLRYTTDSDSVSAGVAAERAAHLKLSSSECKIMEEAIRLAQVPILMHQDSSINEREVYRFWRHAGDAGIDACLLAIADYLASTGLQLNTTEWTLFLQTIGQLFAGYESAMNVEPLLNGHDVMQTFNIEPGAHLGRLLEAIRELQVLGEITSRDAAMAYAKTWLNEEIG